MYIFNKNTYSVDSTVIDTFTWVTCGLRLMCCVLSELIDAEMKKFVEKCDKKLLLSIGLCWTASCCSVVTFRKETIPLITFSKINRFHIILDSIWTRYLNLVFYIVFYNMSSRRETGIADVENVLCVFERNKKTPSWGMRTSKSY